MKIAVLYNRDLYALKALNLLLPGLSTHELALFHSSRVGRAAAQEPEALTMLGNTERQLLEQLNPMCSDGFAGIEALARRYQCTDLPLNDVNKPEGLLRLRAFAPDLILSIRFGKILKAEAIASAPLGVLNLHSGLLPAYRGVMPTFWSMLAEASEIGTTLHWVPDATIDTGPSVAIARRPLNTGVSYLAHVWHLYDLGIPTMIDAVTAIERGDLPRNKGSLPPVSDDGQYFTFPTEAALAEFHRKGLRLVDPDDAAMVLAAAD